MSRGSHLWIDASFGASGDMLLGALAGLAGGVEPLEQLAALGVTGFEIDHGTERRCGLSATRVTVRAEESSARSWSSIDTLIAGADLPPTAAEGARRTFRRLGEVEAAQHGVTIDDVHFHEVGAVDAIVDIVGAWLLLCSLDPAVVTFGPVGLGHGTVKAAHGTLPLPAPATAELLLGHPVRGLDVEGETCTPTGAALLTTMASASGPIPSGSIVATSRGAGGRDPHTHPNVVTAMLIEARDSEALDSVALLIECNVDDVTGEVLAHTLQQLLAAGADDAWLVPIVMKKGRPAHEVRILCAPERAEELRAILLAETGSLGCRTVEVTKRALPRHLESVEIHDQTVVIKVGPHGAKPEHADLVRAAERTGISLRILAAEALAAWSAASRT